MVVEVVVIADSEDDGQAAEEHVLHAADVRKEIQDGVTLTRNHVLIKVHLYIDFHKHVIVFFVGAYRHWFKTKDRAILELRHGIQIHQPVLQLQIRRRYLERNALLHLRVDG